MNYLTSNQSFDVIGTYSSQATFARKFSEFNYTLTPKSTAVDQTCLVSFGINYYEIIDRFNGDYNIISNAQVYYNTDLSYYNSTTCDEVRNPIVFEDLEFNFTNFLAAAIILFVLLPFYCCVAVFYCICKWLNKKNN